MDRFTSLTGNSAGGATAAGRNVTRGNLVRANISDPAIALRRVQSWTAGIAISGQRAECQQHAGRHHPEDTPTHAAPAASVPR